MIIKKEVPRISPGPRQQHRQPRALRRLFLSLLLVPFMLIGTTAWAHAGAATINMNCTLIVPDHPLTAAGLATPYVLKATDPAQGPCLEANPTQSAFVQAAVVNPTTGFLAVYDPLVIDQQTQPAIKPVVPTIPAGSVVSVWFGFNANVLTLQGTQEDTLAESQCVNGLPGSPFGQFAYCNAVNFFAAANQGIKTGKIVPPALKLDRKGQVCPSTRSFFLVDQDQSDNVTTQYLVALDGRLAQNTTANREALPGATVITNPSDNGLLNGVDATLGCTPWMQPDLANPGHLTAALPLNELQAAAHQPAPVALVPVDDPMVLVNTTPNLAKVNLYRVGVDQPVAQTLQDASTQSYCVNLMQVAPSRLALEASLLGRGATPAATVGNTLFTFLAQRYVTTFIGPLGANLACTRFALQPDVATVLTGNGVAVDVLITVNGKKQCFNGLGIKSPMNVCAGATPA